MKMNNKKTQNQKMNKSNDRYLVFFLNSDNQWVQSTKVVFQSMEEAVDYIGDIPIMRVFKMM